MYDKNTLLKKRILAVIGTIETSQTPPGCFSKITGNFDGAGISFGLFQWNIGQNTLQPMLKKYFVKYDIKAQEIFASKYKEVKDMLTKTLAEQLSWAKLIQTANKVNSPYLESFKALGASNEFQDIELEAASSYYNKGSRMATEYGLKSERGVALMVDIAVQNGSISAPVKAIIIKEIAAKGITDEVEKMKVVANRRAEAANSQWIEDVRKRKLMYANGVGTVHGINFDLHRDFAIDMQDA